MVDFWDRIIFRGSFRGIFVVNCMMGLKYAVWTSEKQVVHRLCFEYFLISIITKLTIYGITQCARKLEGCFFILLPEEV